MAAVRAAPATALAAGLLWCAAAARSVLDNGLVAVELDGSAGLVEFSESGASGRRFALSGDAWAVSLQSGELSPGHGCSFTKEQHVGVEANLTFACPSGVEVTVAYRLPTGGTFLEKRLGVHLAEGMNMSFLAATLFSGLDAKVKGAGGESESPTAHVQQNPFQSNLGIAAFLRWAAEDRGLFVSVANPWGRYQPSPSKDSGLMAGYDGHLQHSASVDGSWLWTEPVVLGLTTLTKYSNEGLNTGEREAFMRCVESYHLDREMRRERTVKINVAWDENDYQIDAGTEEGRVEYRRILDRNAQLGVTHLVYEPQNSLHSSRANATDGWGWEEALWFSMGIDLRAGRWDPRTDSVPQDILDMVRYAGTKGIKLLAYAYPTLRFEKMKAHFMGPGTADVLSLAPREVQDYFIDVMTVFMTKTGAGGFAWDHNIYAGDASLQYAQWRGWMRILATLRSRFPDMVMDHRQTAHIWGPWYQLAGSYNEPIAGDENPETYGVPIASLHTDHVAADNMRLTNHRYSTQQLIPPSRVPGFIFHQTERTDDDGTQYCTQRVEKCANNSNTRDFDYLGYKYGLISTIGTAGLNNVFAMIPARDPAEFELLPKEDIDFIHDWLAWTDEHLEELGHTQWIPTLPGPRLGAVDGTHAMANDQGFLFLFNPNMRAMTVSLTVDESLGLSNASKSASWDVEELYPRRGRVAAWLHGEQVSVEVGGSEARVLSLVKRTTGAPAVRLVNAGTVLAEARAAPDGTLELANVSGLAGRTAELAVRAEAFRARGAAKLSVNGVPCSQAASDPNGALTARVHFSGPPLVRAMPVGDKLPPAGFTGGWFNTSFAIPAALMEQLRQRAWHYPIPWTSADHGCGQPHCVNDHKATWLVPTRLLLAPFVAHPSDRMPLALRVDDMPRELQRSYNSRGLARNSCFLGFYWDASSLEAEVPHSLELWLPKLAPGAFQGVFWENVETAYSANVTSCQISGLREIFA